uniref:Carboxylic ester hydrolase n=1 Tax=Helicoverpa armigera TaxID=29058 RepID=D5KXA2_HELAM|nr:carboxylesterase [Helicoverpa armigera]
MKIMYLVTIPILIVLSVAAFTNCDEDEWRKVHIAQGDLLGRKDPAFGLYSFYNIPYATVPSGPDRFKAPLPGPVWEQPREAVDKGVICMQIPTKPTKSLTMQEDCLIANIFVPDTDEKDLPVIVSIHGGGFELGYGAFLAPKYLVKTKKVIAVNFNYRLGVHGFLCLGANDVPGNAGLKDQVALLRWVKENIASFGGNPDDVTITGGSAGSISTLLLMLSKTTEGLFRKVVPESGAAVSSLAVQLDPLEYAKDWAKTLNFTNVDDLAALEDFYKNTPLQSLFHSAQRTDSTLFHSPCIERQTSEQSFLDDSPYNIIKSGNYRKVPILIGTSNMEGLLEKNKFKRWEMAMNENFSEFLPGDLQFDNTEEKKETAKKVKELYFGEQPVSEDTILSYIQYFGDVMFNYPTLRTVQLLIESGHDQIYLYQYSFVDESTPFVPYTKVRGAGHCAQSVAIFDGIAFVTSNESTLSVEYQQMKATMRELWTNFAVHGMPVLNGSSLPAWPTVGADGSPYMILNQPLQLAGAFLEKRAQFWNDLYDRHYRAPVPPQLEH